VRVQSMREQRRLPLSDAARRPENLNGGSSRLAQTLTKESGDVASGVAGSQLRPCSLIVRNPTSSRHTIDHLRGRSRPPAAPRPRRLRRSHSPSDRRSETGIFLGRHQCGHHHRCFQAALVVRDRSPTVLGQIGPDGAGGARRPLGGAGGRGIANLSILHDEITRVIVAAIVPRLYQPTPAVFGDL
jgi:hypothetical protein